jgi:hypothetical protein
MELARRKQPKAELSQSPKKCARALHRIEAQVPLNKTSAKERTVWNAPDGINVVLSSFELVNPFVPGVHFQHRDYSSCASLDGLVTSVMDQLALSF